MLVIHPAFYLSSYVLPKDAVKRSGCGNVRPLPYAGRGGEGDL
jgi:hypothetical protein